MEHIGRCGSYFYKANKTGSVLPPYLIKTGSSIPSGRTVCGHSGWSAFHWNVMSYAASRFLGNRKHRVYHTRIVLGGSSPIDNCFIGGRSPCRYIRRQAFHQKTGVPSTVSYHNIPHSFYCTCFAGHNYRSRRHSVHSSLLFVSSQKPTHPKPHNL